MHLALELYDAPITPKVKLDLAHSSNCIASGRNLVRTDEAATAIDSAALSLHIDFSL